MEKRTLPYWNHNAAYYPWIARQVGSRSRVLDVGCGDGTLARYLAAPGRTVTGLDPDAGCILRARRASEGTAGLRFVLTDFEMFEAAPGSFDAVLFVASLHHMVATAAVEKAAALLSPGGVLLIVGLAAPSTLPDRLLDAARVVPSFVSSRLHRMQSSESLQIPTSYRLPPMAEVRTLAARLPDAVLRYGLHWRYLLKWEKREG